MLDLGKLSGLFRLLLGVALIKVVLMPLLAVLPARAYLASNWHLGVMVIDAAMPSALIGVAFCSTYGGDAKLAARLTLGVMGVSSLTLPVLFRLLT